MGTGEHHKTSRRCHQGECLVTLHNSFAAPHCFVGESEGLGSCSNLCIVRYVMDNLILLGINCDADYTGLSWCVVWAVSGNVRLGSFSICTKLCDGGWLWINPDYLNFPSWSWWEVVKWSKLLSLLQSLHACNAPSWQYVRNDEVEKLRLAGVPGLTQDNVSCIMWHQT